MNEKTSFEKWKKTKFQNEYLFLIRLIFFIEVQQFLLKN